MSLNDIHPYAYTMYIRSKYLVNNFIKFINICNVIHYYDHAVNESLTSGNLLSDNPIFCRFFFLLAHGGLLSPIMRCDLLIR